MKKLLFLLTAILCVSPIAAQSPVSISHIATQYGANPSVTFSVSFTSPPTVPMSLDSVWVFVDYQPITNGSLGAWTPAALATPATVTFATSGSATYPLTSPARGFYIHGNASGAFAATVTVSLTGIDPAATFNWCAYATDYPPNATLGSNAYTLHGTTPFIINGSPLPAGVRTFTGDCISTLTDATSCPGLIPQRPTVSLAPSTPTICKNDTVTLIATASTTNLEYSFNNGPFITNNTATYTLAATADHTVQVRNAAGCLSDVATTTITVIDPPVLTFDAIPATFCADSAFTITASGADSYCFSQTFSDAKRNPYTAGNDIEAAADCEYPPIDCTPSTTPTFTVRVPESGSVTVCVQSWNTFGCQTDSCFTISVTPRAAARLISALSTTNQAVILGAQITPIKYIFNTGACPTVTGLPTTITATCTDDTLTLAGALFAAGTFTYTISHPAAPCPGTTATGTFIVTPQSLSFTQGNRPAMSFQALVFESAVEIDWGDGAPPETVSTTNAPQEYIDILVAENVPDADQARWLNLYHNYGPAQPYTVTATGGRWMYVICEGRSLTDINVSRCPNLCGLEVNGNDLQSLNTAHNPALKILDCAHNQLSSLDISHNTALKKLVCNNNPIGSLDISIHPALEHLICFANQLQTLNTDNNPALKRLECNVNQLSSLDLSNNPLLEYLECSTNQLQDLVLSNNLQLTHLNCAYNQLQQLNLSNNMLLTILYVQVNQLQQLNLVNNPLLNYLHCGTNQIADLDISYNTALTSLYCFENQIADLDISHNPVLTTLSCFANQLQDLVLSNNLQLTHLNCDNNQLQTLSLSNHTALTELYCRSNLLSTLDLSPCTALQNAYCQNNLFDAPALNALFNSLHNNAPPDNKHVWVYGNPGVNISPYDTTIATNKGWQVIEY